MYNFPGGKINFLRKEYQGDKESHCHLFASQANEAKYFSFELLTKEEDLNNVPVSDELQYLHQKLPQSLPSHFLTQVNFVTVRMHNIGTKINTTSLD